jgi:hypothetical protein
MRGAASSAISRAASVSTRTTAPYCRSRTKPALPVGCTRITGVPATFSTCAPNSWALSGANRGGKRQQTCHEIGSRVRARSSSVTRGRPTYIITIPDTNHMTIRRPTATPRYRWRMTSVCQTRFRAFPGRMCRRLSLVARLVHSRHARMACGAQWYVVTYFSYLKTGLGASAPQSRKESRGSPGVGNLRTLELRRAPFFDSRSRRSQTRDLLPANFWTKCPEKAAEAHIHDE